MPNPKDYAILFDASRCIGCKACQVACKQWNDLEAEKTENRGSYANPPGLRPIPGSPCATTRA